MSLASVPTQSYTPKTPAVPKEGCLDVLLKSHPVSGSWAPRLPPSSFRPLEVVEPQRTEPSLADWGRGRDVGPPRRRAMQEITATSAGMNVKDGDLYRFQVETARGEPRRRLARTPSRRGFGRPPGRVEPGRYWMRCATCSAGTSTEGPGRLRTSERKEHERKVDQHPTVQVSFGGALTGFNDVL